jgi:hypothetical protein
MDLWVKHSHLHVHNNWSDLRLLQICSHTLLMRKDLPQKCVSRKLALVSSVNWLEGSQTRKGRGPNWEGVRQGDGFETSFAKVSHIRFCFRCLHLPLASPTVARVYAATFEPVTRVLRSDRLCQFSLPSFPCVLSFSFVRSILFRFFLPRVSFSHLSLFTTFWGMLFTHYVYSYHTDCTMTYSTYIVIRYSTFSLTHLACFPHAESLHCHYIVPLTLATMSFTVDIVASDTPRKFIAHENKFLIGLCGRSAPNHFHLHDWLSH